MTTEKNGSEVKTISKDICFAQINSNSKTGNKLYRNSFENFMQTQQVIENCPVRDGICLVRDTISQESVGVGVKIFATISQMLISNFSWHWSELMIAHVMERS